MNNVIEFKPGCALTEGPVVYKQIRNRHRLQIGNVVLIGETPAQNKWRAYFFGLAEKPQVSWFGRGGDAA